MFSKTLYNLQIIAEPDPHIPEELKVRSLSQLADSGLLGYKHINLKGRVLDGIDNRCSTSYIGRFNLRYRLNNKRSTREILEEAKIKTSGFDELAQENLAGSEGILNLLESHDPLATLYYDDYMSMPMIASQEILLACGLQGAHVHLYGKMPIRFWREETSGNWYDYDVVKNNLFEMALSEISVSGLLGRIIRAQIKSSHKTLKDFSSNSDTVKKLPWYYHFSLRNLIK